MIGIVKGENDEANYIAMLKTIEEFLKDEKDEIANLSNVSALINAYMSDLNWVGFYILKDGDLVLGPFQGQPACIRIKGEPGNGVCFACVKSGKILNVPCVEDFPGHIACDSATKSELVAPIYKNGEIYAVIDLDSPLINRFSSLEEKYIEQAAKLISDSLVSGLSKIIEKTPTPNTVDSLYEQMRSLGINPGDTVAVHSSLSSIGWVCGGQKAVIMALLKAVGPSGTIAMPSHNTDNSEPGKWEAPPVPESWHDTIRQNMPAFDKNSTPTGSIGVIAETFRTYPGTLRSDHPAVSFAANGNHAAEIVETHELFPDFGTGTPLGALYNLNAKVLLLGVSYSNCTALHLAEAKSKSLSKIDYSCAMTENGERIWKTYQDYDYDSEDFPKIGEAYEKAYPGGDEVCKGKIGIADCTLINMVTLVDFAEKYITHSRSGQKDPKGVLR